MNKAMIFAYSLLTLSACGAEAMDWSVFETPVLSADLLVAQRSSPADALVLTALAKEGESDLSSFALLEDTGIRCVQAPCPSTRTVYFDIVEIDPLDSITVRYVAVERLENIPPNVRTAPRHLQVTQISGYLLEWDIFLTDRIDQYSYYTGFPKALGKVQ